MRLPEIERGDSLRTRTLIQFISLVSGARLPDAARVAFYHQDFLGSALGDWSQQAMRGPGGWDVAERELIAAMVAGWNTSAFCIGAHQAVAVHGGIHPETVAACAVDYNTAPISPALRAALTFAEVMTLRPDELTAADAQAALSAGVSPERLVETAAITAIFNIVTRYADALDFAIPTGEEFRKAAGMLLKRGYV